MGLSERRLAEEVKTNEVATTQSAINKAVGNDIPLEIDWESFLDYNEDPINRLKDYALPEMFAAIESVCTDQIGREAFSERVKKIIITNLKPDDDYEKAMPILKDDTLEMIVSLAREYSTNYDKNKIRKYLEDNL